MFPAWILCELSYYSQGHIGQDIYVGRFLLVWAVLYLTVFLGSRHKIAQGILFAAAAISAVAGITLMLESWRSWSGSQTFLSLHTRLWGWAAIAALPLLVALFRFSKSLVPVAVSLAISLALPWCSRTWTESYNYGVSHGSYNRTEPVLTAHALVAAFCVFIIWWGVRHASKALVNLGIVGFGITVIWFYFSDLWDKVGRSLGLIGIGILFLAGGWALEKMRRKLVSQMSQPATALNGGRAMKLSKTSIALLVIQLAIVSTIAAKYLYQRSTCPRVWTRTVAYDPRACHARPLPHHAARRRWLPKHAALCATSQLPTQHQRRPQWQGLFHRRAYVPSVSGKTRRQR